jgi:cobalt-zinc-cadmium efflux system outer membrane protein
MRDRAMLSRSIMTAGLALAASGGGVAAGAQVAPDTLRLAAAVAAVQQANPMLQAARLRADAAADRVSPAGALPDPSLSFGLMNRPIDGFGTDQPMTMNQVQLTQMLPWPGKLGFGKQQAEHLARAGALDAQETEAQLVSRTKATYNELAYIDRAIAIMQRTRDLLRDFYQVSQTRYAVGEGLQQDVLQAQVAIARMTADVTVMQQERVAMAARLNALMGRGAIPARHSRKWTRSWRGRWPAGPRSRRPASGCAPRRRATGRRGAGCTRTS